MVQNALSVILNLYFFLFVFVLSIFQALYQCPLLGDNTHAGVYLAIK